MTTDGVLSAIRRVCHSVGVVIAIAAFAGIAAAQPSQPAFTPAQTQALQQIIHDYILHNPAVVFEALKIQQQAMAKDREETARQAIVAKRRELLADPTSPTGGNPHGDVTIVEFFDYRCPYCKAIEPSVEALLKQDPKLRIVYKEFPILGPASVFAAEVALAAQKQGKYILFHDAMMRTKGNIDDATVLKVARLAGLDIDRLKADLDPAAFGTILRRNYELAVSLNIDGTPGFVIGTDIADGAADIGELKHMIADARQSNE
ncbi:MAG TPA: DsbA family protein [Stellaceae bacterium]|nr:DsbA family protein [Stellaceae bacterium]